MVIPATYAQLTYEFGGAGLPTGAQVTCGLNTQLWEGTPDEAALAARLELDDANIVESLSNVVRLVRTTVRFGPEPLGPTGVDTGQILGGIANPYDTPAVSFLVKKTTGIGGKTARGRWYWPGIPDAQTENAGVMAAAFQTDMQTKFTGWLTSMQGLGLIPVILHQQPSSSDEPPYPIIGMTVERALATQRRRQRR